MPSQPSQETAARRSVAPDVESALRPLVGIAVEATMRCAEPG